MKITSYLLTALFALNLLQIKAQCTASGSHYTASYPAGWNFTHISPATNSPSSDCEDNKQGNIYATGTAAWFFTARGGREMRISRDIPAVSDQSWTMDFTLHITAPAAAGLLVNNSPAIVLASLTNTQAPIIRGCSSGTTLCQSCITTLPTYQPSNVDAMWVELTSNAPTTCTNDTGPDGEYWTIYGYGRNAGSYPSGIGVDIPRNVNATYYIRLQRTSATKAWISVYSDASYSMHVSGSPRCFDISPDISNLNALNHEVCAQGVCNRVFNGIVDHLKIDNNTACGIQPLAPSFTVPSVICLGQPITVDASATIGQPVSRHNWAIVECDSQGNPLGQIPWYGYWDAPDASYTDPEWITETTTITCGKYYKIYLTVENCNESVTTSKVIRIACAPTISASPDVTICQGESTTLSYSFRGSPNVTVVWESTYPTHQFFLGSPQLTVSPPTTTNYQVTLYDNTTGCSSVAYVTVYVIAHDPSFNLTVNTSNPSYFTLTLNPNDLTAYSTTTGFMYGLTIEELNGSLSPYYWNSSMGGTTCWWNYPTPETFKGFVSTGTGTFTQLTGSSGCGTVPGKFLYNHTYRITRLVVNDYCPAKQVSMIITSSKSGNSMEIVEDPNAPDMTAFLMAHPSPEATDNITIFPNPSTGIFTIELGDEETAAQIEVTDALGQKVKTFSHTGLRSELDMTGFTKGIYMVTITTNGNSTIKKIILE